MKKIFSLLIRLLTWQSMIDGVDSKWNKGFENNLPRNAFLRERLSMILQRENVQKLAISLGSIILLSLRASSIVRPYIAKYEVVSFGKF